MGLIASALKLVKKFHLRLLNRKLSTIWITIMSVDDLRKLYGGGGHDLSDLYSHDGYRWVGLVGDVPVGNVSLKNVNHMMKFAEIGYGVGEQYQGKGYGTEMVRQLVAMAFQETDLRKLIAYVHDKNTPSCKLLERLGFQKEGLLREHYIINGKPENEVLYAILRGELGEGDKPLSHSLPTRY